ncbi:uncharacterized protein [Diadema antillarum]|uniref:uncharacterized protein n=1 Tax=Diadema antillarum TaxID=105358 RepID=UPI003A8C24D6
MAFHLNTGHQRSLSGFQNRTDDVFGSLAGLEKDYDKAVLERGPDEFMEERDSEQKDFKTPKVPHHRSGRSRREHKDTRERILPSWKQRGGRGSNRQGRGRRQREPDYKLHPERWTEYSLEDTDLSGESANKRAAIDFLREIRERKAKEQRSEVWDADLYCDKIQFKKPVEKAKDEQVAESMKPMHGDVHKMPEYIVGQKKARLSKKTAASSTVTGGRSADCVALGHLGEEEPVDQSDKTVRKLNQSEERTTKEISPSTGDKDAPGSDMNASSSGGENVSFQKKGKGKRKIRERKSNDED